MKTSHIVKEAARRVFAKLMAMPSDELQKKLSIREVGSIGEAILSTNCDDYSCYVLAPIIFGDLSSQGLAVRPIKDDYGWCCADNGLDSQIEMVAEECLKAA
jgi:hypothetical protein